MRFTDRFVVTLKAPSARKIIWEDGEHGKGTLGLRISPSGSKVWIYMYHDPRDGKSRMATLGKYPGMTVAQAHEAHAKAVQSIEKGGDPAAPLVQKKREERLAPTVAILAEEYIERWAKPRKRSWKEDVRILSHDILPAWRNLPVTAVTRRDVIALIDSIVERGAPVVANRTLALVRTLFNFAVDRALLEFSPATRVKMPSPENPRARVLDDNELHILWNALWHNHPAIGLYPALRLDILFQLTTASRPTEALGLPWEEIVDDWWTIPETRAKNGVAVRIPLSEPARSILDRARQIGDTIHVFPSPRGDTPMAKGSPNHALQRIAPKLQLAPFTAHDLRRTAATQMSALGVSRFIIDKLLNHLDPSVGGIYDRYSYAKEKQAAMDVWGQKLESLSH